MKVRPASFVAKRCSPTSTGDAVNGPARRSDLAYDLVVSPDGTKVFVTGSSDGIDSGSDYATLAYAAVVPGTSVVTTDH